MDIWQRTESFLNKQSLNNIIKMSKSILFVMVLFKIQVNVVFGSAGVSPNTFNDYCSLPCKDYLTGAIYTHTVCSRAKQSCAPSNLCIDYESPSMTDYIRQAILDKHNELRNKVAAGGETSQPAAANMNVLNWDMELEFIAQCLANTCEFKHDKCRRTSEFEVGQNLAILWHSDQRQLTVEATTDLVQEWYDEVKAMHASFVDEFPSYYSGPVIGHYTQLIWAEAEFVGCGRSLYKEGSMYTMYLVCNYGGYATPGNLMGDKIYEQGKGCSQCKKKSCNSQYKALCGDVIPVGTNDLRGWTLGVSAISADKYLVMFPLLFWGIIIRIYM